MARIARVVASGYPHQVTQRGNYHQTVFETDDKYLLYLKYLIENCGRKKNHGLCPYY